MTVPKPLTVWITINCGKFWKSLPYDPAIPLLAINLEKTIIRKDTCTPMLVAVLFMIAKQPRCPSAELWIKRMCYIYTMEYHSAVFLFLNTTSWCRISDRLCLVGGAITVLALVSESETKTKLVLYGLTANSSWFPQQSCNRPIDVTFPHASYPLHPISPGTSLPELQLTNLLLCQPGDSPSTSPGPHLPGLLYPQLQYLLRLLLGRASREASW